MVDDNQNSPTMRYLRYLRYFSHIIIFFQSILRICLLTFIGLCIGYCINIDNPDRIAWFQIACVHKSHIEIDCALNAQLVTTLLIVILATLSRVQGYSEKRGKVCHRERLILLYLERNTFAWWWFASVCITFPVFPTMRRSLSLSLSLSLSHFFDRSRSHTLRLHDMRPEI